MNENIESTLFADVRFRNSVIFYMENIFASLR